MYFSWWSALGSISVLYKPNAVECACHPSTQAKGGRLELQVHPQLHIKWRSA